MAVRTIGAKAGWRVLRPRRILGVWRVGWRGIWSAVWPEILSAVWGAADADVVAGADAVGA